MESEGGSEAVADLKTQLGDLQIGGGGDMLIDDYDLVDEKPDVAIITPDGSSEEPEPEVLADDCIYSQTSQTKHVSDPSADDAMRKQVLPEIPDLETDSEAHHTWQIEDWRALTKKARGPTFYCGGHPWYVVL